MTTQLPLVLKYAGNLLLVLGVTLAARTALSGDGAVHRQYRRYTARLDRSLHLLFLPGKGTKIAILQAAGIALFTIAGIWVDPLCHLGSVVCAFGPMWHLARKRKQHIRSLEGQTDALLVGLANSLKTVPSPAAALSQATMVLPSPMRLEIERLLREMRVGGTLEQSLLNMSARLKSPDLDAAFSAMLIGVQVGGNLAQVLESTSETLREMGRLEGVVRSKTAEGRAQLWVLGLFPIGICLALRLVDPDYFAPLQTSTVGSIVSSVALVLWLTSLLLARKIMQVDI
jgi:tight adherence protein B